MGKFFGHASVVPGMRRLLDALERTERYHAEMANLGFSERESRIALWIMAQEATRDGRSYTDALETAKAHLVEFKLRIGD